ncbi:MAG: HDIG domain-containing protein [Candidatus Bathyarchaeota archaeon]|nr:MAG: HDIG domain-containing protein [Candidatus Bathyarchaeota archaeon]
MITREESLKLAKQHVKNKNLVNHMIAVSAIMGRMAEHFGEDPQLWEAVGMLHDVDYEQTSDNFSKHGLISAEMVADLLPEEGLRAIRAHNEMTGMRAESRMEVSLFAADAVSGMIVAGALVRPSRLEGMKPKSIIRRMKDKSFARAVSRENIRRCEELGMELSEFLALSIEAMQSVGKQIGL